MAGARRIGGAEVSYAEAAALALSAGCDLVLLCNQSIDGGAAVDALLDELQAAEAAGGWQADSDGDRRRLDLLPQTAPIVWDDLMHDPAYQRSLERLP
jgi:beta-N-acetylhexosaminidase